MSVDASAKSGDCEFWDTHCPIAERPEAISGMQRWMDDFGQTISTFFPGSTFMQYIRERGWDPKSAMFYRGKLKRKPAARHELQQQPESVSTNGTVAA